MNNSKKSGRSSSVWKVHGILLKNPQFKKETTGEIRKYCELIKKKKNENKPHQKLWDITTLVLRGKPMAINAVVKGRQI